MGHYFLIKHDSYGETFVLFTKETTRTERLYCLSKYDDVKSRFSKEFYDHRGVQNTDRITIYKESTDFLEFCDFLKVQGLHYALRKLIEEVV